MEKRNPTDVDEKNYMNDITEKTFKPRIFWQRCECCGNEFRKIPIFRVTRGSLHFTFRYEYNGCSNCFHDVHEFRKWLEDNERILTHENFQYMKSIEDRIRNGDETITKADLKRYTELQWL